MEKITQGQTTTQNITPKSEIAKNNSLQGWQNTRAPKLTRRLLEGGKSIWTANGGDLQPIMYKQVNAGEKIEEWDIQGQIRILAPKVPTADNLYLQVRAGYVPMTYMVENYDNIKANKAEYGATPNTSLPVIQPNAYSQDGSKSYMDYWAWKTKTMSFYVPNSVNSSITINVLPVRAYHAFRNAFCRNKMWQPANMEFKEQTPTQAETELIRGTWQHNPDVPVITTDYGAIQKDQKRNNYYTNIKSMVQRVVDENAPNFPTLPTTNSRWWQNQTPNSGLNMVLNQTEFNGLGAASNSTTPASNNQRENIQMLTYQTTHTDWQNSIAEYRRQVENSIDNDWDIIAKLGGTAAVTTDRPYFLGEVTKPVNYQQITATGNAANGDNNTAPLGATGAFSVNFIGERLFGHADFKQDGYIIITASVVSDNTYEEAIHRSALHQKTTDFYNPELATQQIDILYRQEIAASGGFDTSLYNVGFKKKYSETYTMPNTCIRDVRTKTLIDADGNEIPSMSQWHNMDTLTVADVSTNPAFWEDDTEALIARNSLTTGDQFKVFDQILGAFKHNVIAWVHELPTEVVRGTDTIVA